MTNTHDFKLFKKSRLPIREETIVCVDTGYLGLANLHKNIEMPKKKTKLNPLTKDDKLANKEKSSKRIPVEHINAKIKAFKIVATKYRNRRKRFGLRFNLICALINFDRGFAVK
jgi:transposase